MVTSDAQGIRKVIRTLKRDDWILRYVNDGEENVKVRTEAQAVEAITAVDEAWLFVSRYEERGWCFFVLGNEPWEVLADYTINLTVLDDLDLEA